MPSTTAELSLPITFSLKDFLSSPEIDYSVQSDTKQADALTFIDNIDNKTDVDEINIVNDYNGHVKTITMSIINRYYSLTNADKNILLSNLDYNDEFFNYLIDFPFNYVIDSIKLEIITILLTKFPNLYFDKLLDIISDENRSVFQRLYLIELTPFFVQYNKNEIIRKLDAIKSQISNKHVISFIQETISSIEE